jgi:hypothetical protein
MRTLALSTAFCTFSTTSSIFIAAILTCLMAFSASLSDCATIPTEVPFTSSLAIGMIPGMVFNDCSASASAI